MRNKLLVVTVLFFSVVFAQSDSYFKRESTSNEKYTLRKYMKKPATLTGELIIDENKKFYEFNGIRYKLLPVVFIATESDTIYFNRTLVQMEKTNIPDRELSDSKSLESIAKSLRTITTIQTVFFVAAIATSVLLMLA